MNFNVDRPDFASYKPFQTEARAWTPSLGDPNRPLAAPKAQPRPGSAMSAKTSAIRVKQHVPKYKQPNEQFRVNNGSTQPELSTPNLTIQSSVNRKNDWFRSTSRSRLSPRVGTPLWKNRTETPPVLVRGKELTIQPGADRSVLRDLPLRRASSAASRGRPASSLLPNHSYGSAHSHHHSVDHHLRFPAGGSSSVNHSRVEDSSSSDDDEHDVRDLENWRPNATEVQQLARSIIWKYRTSKHTSNNAVTVWDFVLEKPTNRDPRILAEIQRFQAAHQNKDRPRQASIMTSSAIIAESLGLH